MHPMYSQDFAPLHYHLIQSIDKKTLRTKNKFKRFYQNLFSREKNKIYLNIESKICFPIGL